jgi:metal-responsive CopG/Arc/MetJ family transcriptional regulator
MATVNFSVPDDVREAFNETFRGRNKSAIIADMMRDAVEHEKRKEIRHQAIERILARHTAAPKLSVEELEQARKADRP